MVLLLFAACYGAFKALNSPIDQTVYKVEKVNSKVSLYITEGSAGATTNFVYQFYLVHPEITKEAFLKGIGDKYQPFLSTSDGNAKVDINDGSIHLDVKGNVYCFNNGASYSAKIYLNASPF
jgi:hypothetical protein